MKTVKSRNTRAFRWSSILISLGIILYALGCNSGPPENSRAAQAMRGKALFEKHCADCHGEDAPLADEQSVPVPDLTKINDRWGGKFPVVEIARIIDGRQYVQAHGNRDMPVWGEVFKQEGAITEEEISGKMGELVAYLISIQK